MAAETSVVCSTEGKPPTNSKVRLSCDTCKNAKIRCGQQRPACDRCLARGFSCVYSPSMRMGRPRRRTEQDSSERARPAVPTTPINKPGCEHDGTSRNSPPSPWPAGWETQSINSPFTITSPASQLVVPAPVPTPAPASAPAPAPVPVPAPGPTLSTFDMTVMSDGNQHVTCSSSNILLDGSFALGDDGESSILHSCESMFLDWSMALQPDDALLVPSPPSTELPSPSSSTPVNAIDAMELVSSEAVIMKDRCGGCATTLAQQIADDIMLLQQPDLTPFGEQADRQTAGILLRCDQLFDQMLLALHCDCCSRQTCSSILIQCQAASLIVEALVSECSGVDAHTHHKARQTNSLVPSGQTARIFSTSNPSAGRHASARRDCETLRIGSYEFSYGSNGDGTEDFLRLLARRRVKLIQGTLTELVSKSSACVGMTDHLDCLPDGAESRSARDEIRDCILAELDSQIRDLVCVGSGGVA